MYDYTSSYMKTSTRIGVSGARPHRKIVHIIPVDNKILMFMLRLQLIEFYITNSIGSLAMSILCAYKHSVVNELWNLL